MKACRQRNIALLVLALAVLLVFWPVCRHDFVNYDDQINVYENGLVANPTAANFLVVWQKPYLNLYVPLTYSFWMLQAKLSTFLPGSDGVSLSPPLFHSANLLFHLANALLVFLILGHLLKDPWAVLAGAFLFAVHPVQVEPVAWVTGFKDVFSSFWSLLTIWQYLIYCRLSADGHKRRRLHYGLTLLFMLAGLLSKPGAVSVPVVVALLGYFGARRGLRQVVWEVAPLLVMTLPFMIMTKMEQPDAPAKVLPDLGQRLLICGDTFSFYVGKILLPLTIGPYYGRTPKFVLAQDWRYLTGLIPYLLLAWLVWKGTRQARLAAGIFVVSILPVSGLVSFIFQSSSTVADRYLYTAMLGAALGLGLLVAKRQDRATRAVLFGLIAILALRSMPLVRSWQDSITFNEYGLRGNPDSRVGHNNLGKALLDSGRLDEAYQHFAESVRILPTEIAYTNMGAIKEMQGATKEATTHYLQSIWYNTLFFISYQNLVEMLGRTNTLAEGVRYFDETFVKHPKPGPAHLNFGTALLNAGHFPEAALQLEKAIQLGSRSETAHSLLADALTEMKRWDEALTHYQAALAANPNFAEAHNGLGLLRLQQGDHQAAAESFRQALRLKPGMPHALGNLAYTYSAMGRHQDAAQQYSAILDLNPDAVVAHNGLGLSLLQLGQVEQAIGHFRTALALQPDYEEARQNLEMAMARQGGR